MRSQQWSQLPTHELKCSLKVTQVYEYNLYLKMENFINNPGFQHLAENIFCNLELEDLKLCGLINQSCKQILDNPMFWLKKFRSLSEENEKNWIKTMKSVNNSGKEKAIISYLQWNLKKKVVDLPCYSSPAAQDHFRKKIRKICQKHWWIFHAIPVLLSKMTSEIQ